MAGRATRFVGDAGGTLPNVPASFSGGSQSRATAGKQDWASSGEVSVYSCASRTSVPLRVAISSGRGTGTGTGTGRGYRAHGRPWVLPINGACPPNWMRS